MIDFYSTVRRTNIGTVLRSRLSSRCTQERVCYPALPPHPSVFANLPACCSATSSSVFVALPFSFRQLACLLPGYKQHACLLPFPALSSFSFRQLVCLLLCYKQQACFTLHRLLLIQVLTSPPPPSYNNPHSRNGSSYHPGHRSCG